jgi:hypothetical protein
MNSALGAIFAAEQWLAPGGAGGMNHIPASCMTFATNDVVVASQQRPRREKLVN